MYENGKSQSTSGNSTSATGTLYRSRSRRRRRLVVVLTSVATALVVGLLAMASSGGSPVSLSATASPTTAPATDPAGPAALVRTGPPALDTEVEFELVPTGLEPGTGSPQPSGFPVGDGINDTPTGKPLEPSEPPEPTPAPTPAVAVPEPAMAAVPAPTPTPTLGGIVAPGLPVGCAAGCLTKAWLTPSATSTDMKLEVRTDTLARIAVTVGAGPPAGGGATGPQIADPVATASTGQDYETVWHTTLTGLAPGTGYHIVVSARDAAGGISTEVGEFATPTPANGLSAGEPGGCAANCVKQALITPTPGAPGADLTVTTHVPATMAVYVSEDAPQIDDAGQPRLPGVPAADTTGGEPRTEWATTLPLEYATTYHAVLRVTDDQSRHQFLQASFTTLPAPAPIHHNRVIVTFHKVHVSDDADNTFFNRTGELAFRFQVNGERLRGLDTGERKVKAPAWVSLDDGDRAPGRSVVVENAPDKLQIEVQAHERDRNRPGFCALGVPWFEEVSGREALDGCFELEWNTASAAVDLHPEPQDNALPPCYGFDGITGDFCVLLRATGADPAFDVYVTVDFLD